MFLRSSRGVQALTLLNFADFQRLSSDVQQRLTVHERTVWAVNGGVHTAQIMRSLPKGVRNEILISVCTGLVCGVPVFAQAPKRFIQRLVHAVQFEYHSEGEAIARDKDVGRDLFFIARGFVEILSDDVQYAKKRLPPPKDAPPNAATANGNGAAGAAAGAAPAPGGVAVASAPGGPPSAGGAAPAAGAAAAAAPAAGAAAAVPPGGPYPGFPGGPPLPPMHNMHILEKGEFFTGMQLFTGQRLNRFTAVYADHTLTHAPPRPHVSRITADQTAVSRSLLFPCDVLCVQCQVGGAFVGGLCQGLQRNHRRLRRCPRRD
jgi:hypothetical protein